MTRYKSSLAPFQWIIAATLLFASSIALAAPIRYTGFVITDGQLGNWKFHNARVTLTFDSDTKYVEMLGNVCAGVNAAYNPTGVARVTIADHEKVVNAKFAPNQIFVGFDQDNGGVGFGSFAPGPLFDAATCANPESLQPSYPLGLHHGQEDWAADTGDSLASANQEALPWNLQGNAGFSGTGYICVGEPRFDCETVTTPLKTDHGDFYLFQPYTGMAATGYESSMNGALFIQTTGEPASPLPASVMAPWSSRASGGITYHMLLISDVSLDGDLYQGATIHLSFQSKTSSVAPLADAGPYGAINADGVARVDITTKGRTVSAAFDPKQIYVYFDPVTASAGFGSFSGGRAYPAVVSPTFAFVDNDLTAAVSAILTSGSTAFSAATVNLARVTDLKHETMLSDEVSSCTDYDFSKYVGVCFNLPSAGRLTTNKGDFYLYQPYNVVSNTPATMLGTSDNWGIFWTTLGADD